MKKYRASDNKIECFEVVKETATMLTFKLVYDWTKLNTLRKEAKESTWHSWHDTFQDAKNYLIKKQKDAIENLNKSIAYFEEKLEYIQNLKEEV